MLWVKNVTAKIYIYIFMYLVFFLYKLSCLKTQSTITTGYQHLCRLALCQKKKRTEQRFMNNANGTTTRCGRRDNKPNRNVSRGFYREGNEIVLYVCDIYIYIRMLQSQSRFYNTYYNVRDQCSEMLNYCSESVLRIRVVHYNILRSCKVYFESRENKSVRKTSDVCNRSDRTFRTNR